jgi:hypothetical protein
VETNRLIAAAEMSSFINPPVLPCAPLKAEHASICNLRANYMFEQVTAKIHSPTVQPPIANDA